MKIDNSSLKEERKKNMSKSRKVVHAKLLLPIQSGARYQLTIEK